MLQINIYADTDKSAYQRMAIISIFAALITGVIADSVVNDMLAWLFFALAFMSFMAIFECKWHNGNLFSGATACAIGIIISKLDSLMWDKQFTLQDMQWWEILGTLLALFIFTGVVRFMGAKTEKA